MLRNNEISVLQDWVMVLPLREQGTLLTCVRGCDLTPKLPLDSPERWLVGALRNYFMVPADEREVDIEPGCFFRTELPPNFKASGLGHYPLHWVSHVIHASEVIAYRHPTDSVREMWLKVYHAFCKNLHMNPETFEQFKARMCEDRIEQGTVVS